MFLVTCPLIDPGEARTDRVYLGPWAVPDRMALLEGQELPMLPSPWADRERFFQAYRDLDIRYERYLLRLATYLNEVQGQNLPSMYWRIILGPWLIHSLHAFYDRYELLREALAAEPDLETALLDPASFITPADNSHYLELASGHFQHAYAWQFFSQALIGMGFDFPRSTRALQSRGTGKNWKELVRSLAGSAITRLTLPFAGVVLHGQTRPMEFLHIAGRYGWRLGLLREKFPSRINPGPWPDDPRRKGLALLGGDDEFERLFTRWLPVNFPSLYLEGHSQARMYVQGLPCGRMRVFCSTGGVHHEECAKYLAAELTLRGVRLINAQHGGGYGMGTPHLVERHERTIADRFFCWGWSGQETDPKLLDVPGLKPSRLHARLFPSVVSRDILIVSTAQTPYLYRFHSSPVHAQWVQYFRDVEIFVRGLGVLAADALHRFRSDECGWPVRDWLAKRLPKLRQDDLRRTFLQRLSACRLAVFDHPSTPWLEALAANSPALIFFRSEAWPLRPETAPILDRLRQAGLMFNDPEQAARQVIEIYSNIKEWWSLPQIQEAANLARQSFAFGSPDWASVWAQTLAREYQIATDKA